ncbi:MAG TPA: hypothetical protein VJH97_04775 [Candidatus Nanoarchaeia archaeon]|nr:hypothetical protein [Candidatus Nanoarchaeia archaeon]
MANIDSLSQYVLYIYSLKSLPQKRKVKVIRELFGYKNEVEKKTYHHKGLLQNANAQKLGQNVILVPMENSLDFANYFNKNGLQVEARQVWLKQ